MSIDEGVKRDEAINRARGNPHNNYQMITDIARRWLLLNVPTGRMIVAGQVFRKVMEYNPNLQPREKRVMGAVMRQLEKEKLIIQVGTSTRERSHRGWAREWRRT